METLKLENFNEKLKERFGLGEIAAVEILCSYRSKSVSIYETANGINITVPFGRGNTYNENSYGIAAMIKKYRNDYPEKVDNALRQLADMDCVRFITLNKEG